MEKTGCCNQHTHTKYVEAEDEDDVEMENAVYNDLEDERMKM